MKGSKTSIPQNVEFTNDAHAVEESLTPTIENVLPFYLQKAKSSRRVCLVTLYNVDTVSPRPLGSQIAVSEDGTHFGFITGGCAESAIVHEALMAIKENQSRTIRIGSDSPWFDIKLPCGAGIDLHFSVSDSRSVVTTACELLANREPVSLAINTKSDRIEVVQRSCKSVEDCDGTFIREYVPQTRLAIVGAGPYVEALARLGQEAELDVVVWSSEQDAKEDLPQSHYLLSRKTILSPSQLIDEFTAAVLLFHEHDWEPKLLRSILQTDCFYIGALGSRQTHANRLHQLREQGVAESQLARISGPVGIPIFARTPTEIAVSVLAEVICTRNATWQE